MNWLPAVESKQKMLKPRKKCTFLEKSPEKSTGRVYRTTIKEFKLLLADILAIIFEKPNHCMAKKTTGHICILLRIMETFKWSFDLVAL